MSLATWTLPTAPVKSFGRPSVGSGNTLRSETGLETVISLGLIEAYRLCRKGAPILAAIEISSDDRVLILMLIGASTDSAKSPGFTAASTLCQVMRRN